MASNHHVGGSNPPVTVWVATYRQDRDSMPSSEQATLGNRLANNNRDVMRDNLDMVTVSTNTRSGRKTSMHIPGVECHIKENRIITPTDKPIEVYPKGHMDWCGVCGYKFLKQEGLIEDLL